MVIRTKTGIKTTIDAVYFVSFCILHQPYITYSITATSTVFSQIRLLKKRFQTGNFLGKEHMRQPFKNIFVVFLTRDPNILPPPPHPTKSLEVLQPPPPRLVITTSSIPKPFRFLVDFLSLPTFFVAPKKKICFSLLWGHVPLIDVAYLQRRRRP